MIPPRAPTEQPDLPEDLQVLDRHLRGALHRFDCPTAHTLGEYELDLLAPELRTTVAAHVVDCPRCADELRTLRSFLREDPIATGGEARGGPRHALSRIVAALVPAPAALSAIRGAASTHGQMYRAGGYTITLVVGERARRERPSLVGLVTRDDNEDGDPKGAPARLIRLAQPSHVHAARIDELGNVAFEGIEPGLYDLELELSGQVVVIESLALDQQGP